MHFQKKRRSCLFLGKVDKAENHYEIVVINYLALDSSLKMLSTCYNF